MKKNYLVTQLLAIAGISIFLGDTHRSEVLDHRSTKAFCEIPKEHPTVPQQPTLLAPKVAAQRPQLDLQTTKNTLYHNISDPATQGEIDSYFGGLLWGAAYGVQGSGLVIGQFEAGGFPDSLNAALIGRITKTNRLTTGPATGFDNGHATPVALRLIGNGTGGNRGIAPEANIEAYRIQNSAGTISYVETDLETRLADNQQPLMLVSNHSYTSRAGWKNPAFNWGGYNWWSEANVSTDKDFKFGYYHDRDEAFDEISFDHPEHTIVVASGNNRGFGVGETNAIGFFTSDGINYSTYDFNAQVPPTPLPEVQNFDCIPWGSLGKNVITVGAVSEIPGGYNQSADASILASSSIGPTDDGRIKPDLVAPSTFLTSGAAPQVSGSVLLLQELHHKNYNSYLTSASMKALLIHTAFETNGSPAPDYEYGWGMLNPTAAADVLLRKVPGAAIQEAMLANGATTTRYIYLDGTQPFKASIAWIDPAGVAKVRTYGSADLDHRTPQLVNDLDLRLAPLSNPAAVVLPWKLDALNPSAPATQADNTVDNIEQVYAATPSEGWYTLTITHKNTLKDNAAQPYSLVYSGAADLSCDAVLDANTPLVFDGSNWTPSFTNNENVRIQGNVSFSGTVVLRDLIAEAVTIELQNDVEVTGQVLLAPGTEITGPGKLILKGSQSLCGGSIRHLELDGNNIVLSGGPVNIKDLVTLKSGTTTTQNGNLVLKGEPTSQQSYAQLEEGGGNLTGDITVEAYAIGGTRGWRHIGFPVTTNVADIANDYKYFTLDNSGAAANFWSATNGAWEVPAALTTPLNGTTPMAIFLGRRTSDNFQFTEMPHRIQITGARHTGIVNNTIVFGAAAPSAGSQQGWNFIANPYPQNLDWDVIEARIPAVDMDKAYYVLDGGAGENQYISYVGGLGDAGRFISPMQAFFVKANNSSAEVTTAFNFTNADRSSLKADFRKTSPEHIKLLVTGDQVSDALYLAFRDSATFGFDGAFDAYKLRAAGSEAPLLFHPNKISEKDMSIQSVPRGLRSYNFDVRFESIKNQVFQLEAQQFEMPAEVYLVLEDLKTGQRMAPFDAAYSFAHTGGGRDFVLKVFANATDAHQTDPTAHVWIKEGRLQINLLADEKIEEVSVYSTTGQPLFTKQNLEGSQHQWLADWAPRSGVCVVVLTFPDRVERIKVLIQ